MSRDLAYYGKLLIPNIYSEVDVRDRGRLSHYAVDRAGMQGRRFPRHGWDLYYSRLSEHLSLLLRKGSGGGE
jgi:hypothetical protein